MARYSRIDRRMWGDDAFRRLSKPQPNAQTLFVYLLTGPHVENIPGVFSTGEAGLAEALGWPLKAFRKAFLELSRKPLVKADWNARFLFIPNTIRYNPPANPNVVKSWRATWDELPECPLKSEAKQHLGAFLKDMGEGFAKAFQEAIVNPLAKPLPNQEQDQEQEQEQESPLSPHGGNGSGEVSLPPESKRRIPCATNPLDGHRAGFVIFWHTYPRREGKGACEKWWARHKPDEVLLGQMLAKIEAAKQSDQWQRDGGRFIPMPATWLNQKRWEDDFALAHQQQERIPL